MLHFCLSNHKICKTPIRITIPQIIVKQNSAETITDTEDNYKLHDTNIKTNIKYYN
jgi:hypothetical protein